METVNTLSKFLSELENHLLIYPDKQGIKQFFKVVEFIKKSYSLLISDEYFARVESLTAELKPSDTAVVINNQQPGARGTCVLM